MSALPACLDDLSVVSGCLGLRPVEGSADDLTRVTKLLISEFCAPDLGVPRNFCPLAASKEVSPTKLEKTLLAKVTILVSDAAANELLSGEILRGKRVAASSSEAVPWMPGVVVVGRDGAHASTRVLKRPFLHNPEINALMTEFITGGDSFGQKVFHSPLFSAWWKDAVQEEAGDPEYAVGTSMAAAKHRFASHALPLGRVCRNIAAVLQVCHRIHAARGSGAAWAEQILRNVTARKLFLLALAADAAHACLDFTRWADNESVDVGQLNDAVSELALNIRRLFNEEQAHRLPTHAQAMKKQLDSGLTVIAAGCIRELKLSDSDYAYAYHVMQNWVGSAEAALDAEFPSWHLLSSFGVFNLSSRRKAGGCLTPVKAALAKLAAAFDLDPLKLEQQYVALLPVSEALHKEGRFTNRAAWTEALRRRSLRAKQGWEELRQTLVMYATWSVSSSGVEQLFSKVKKSPIELSSASVDTDRRTAVVMGSIKGTATEERDLIATAQKYYCDLLRSGKSRAQGPEKRLDKGAARATTKVVLKKGKKSEAAWHRRRRAAVAKSAELATPPRKMVVEADLPESAKKELDKQKAGALKRKAQAYLDGYLAKEESTPTVMAEAEKLRKVISGGNWDVE